MPNISDESGMPAEQRSERLLLAYLIIIVVGLAAASHYPRFLAPTTTAEAVSDQPQLARGEIANTSSTILHPQRMADDAATRDRLGLTPSSVPQSEDSAEPSSDEADTAQPSEGSQKDEAAKLGLLDTDFSLVGTDARAPRANADTSEPIRVRKTVAMGNATIGSLPITIDSDSRLSLEIRDLRQLLQGQAGFTTRLERVPESGTISFERLRDAGIDLRYNPTSDQVTLQRL